MSTHMEEEKHHMDQRDEGGRPVTHSLTAGSEQIATVAPDITIRAIIVTIAAGIYWINQLYTITTLAAYSRNIVAALGGSNDTAWIFNAFNVITVVLAPIFSFYSDLHGRKWIIVGSLIFGMVGGAVACRANSVGVVIVGTAICGIPGSLLGVVTAVPSEILPHRYRSAGQALVFTLSAFAAFPALLGPSYAIRNDPVDGWRSIFYSYIGSYALLTALWFLAYNPPARKTSLTQDRPSLDFIGYGLLAAAITPFLIGLTFGGTTYPWASAGTLAPLLVGIAMFGVFGAWEWKGRDDGILHHDLFLNRNFALTCMAIFVEGFVYLGFTSLYPAQMATTYDHDIFTANQKALPFYGAFIIALPLGGLYVNKTRDTITPIIFGYVLLTGALIGFACSNANTLGLFVGMDVLAGFGFALPLTFLTVVAQFAAPSALIGTSTAVVLSVRTLGGSVGIAAVNTLFDSKIGHNLPSYIAAAVLPLGLPPQLLGPVIGAAASGNPATIAQVSQIPGVTPQILGAAFGAAESAFAASYRYCWILLIPFSVLGTLSILVLQRNKDQLDFIVDQPLEPVHHHKARAEGSA